jgi:hypothetical protein
MNVSLSGTARAALLVLELLSIGAVVAIVSYLVRGGFRKSPPTAKTHANKGPFLGCLSAVIVGSFFIIFFYWFGSVVLRPHDVASPRTIGESLEFWKQKPLHPNYKREFCDSYVVHDLKAADHKLPVHIHLTEGCYGDEWKFPVGVKEYFIQKSTHTGDYATLWCNGHPNPTPIVDAYTAGMGGEISAGCSDFGDPSMDFRAQGQGEITFYPTVYNH